MIVDGPGNGESIRFRNLYLRHDTEHYGTPAWEYLASRQEIDTKRIGVMAISLGGTRRARPHSNNGLSVAAQHILWVLNASSEQDVLKRLEPFNLDA